MIEIVPAVLTAMGLAFFIPSNVDLRRLPQVYARLHARAKADNFGLPVIGLVPLASNAVNAERFISDGVLVSVSSAAGAHLIAQSARR